MSGRSSASAVRARAVNRVPLAENVNPSGKGTTACDQRDGIHDAGPTRNDKMAGAVRSDVSGLSVAAEPSFANTAAGAALIKSWEEEIILETNVKAWKHPTGRKYWLLSGARPGMLEWEQAELQAWLAGEARATQSVTAQLAKMDNFDVSDYVFDGASIDPAIDMSLAEQMEVLVDVVMKVVQKDAASTAASVERVSTLRGAFQQGVDIVRDHARKRFWAARKTRNRARIAWLVNDDLKTWSTSLNNSSIALESKWAFPPNSESLPPVPVPMWASLNRDIGTIGVLTEDEHAGYAHRTKRMLIASKQPSDISCRAWATNTGCRYKKRCRYAHHPDMKGEGG